jgi:hypothetical protein
MLVAACAQEQRGMIRVDPCRDSLDRAAVAREVNQQIALLDAALVICRDVSTFAEGLRLHPGAIAVAPTTFVQRRCENPPNQTVARSSICQAVVPPTESTPSDNSVQVYVGRTLDGQTVELRSDRIRFTEGRPWGIVEIVEISTRQGCAGLAGLYAQWIPLLELEDRGDESSVYAQHTLNVMQSLGCESPAVQDAPDTEIAEDSDG